MDNRLMKFRFWTYLTTFLVALMTLIFVPKVVFSSQSPHQLGISLANLNEDNVLLYDYKVYSNESRFNQGLIDDVALQKEQFIARKEILLVKIPGVEKTEFFPDYILMHSENVPELNIEYYLVKNIVVAETSLPARTFILLLEDIFRLINTIYLVLIMIIFFVIALPLWFKIIPLFFALNPKKTKVLTFKRKSVK